VVCLIFIATLRESLGDHPQSDRPSYHADAFRNSEAFRNDCEPTCRECKTASRGAWDSCAGVFGLIAATPPDLSASLLASSALSID
jgi:hypothetical protein